MRRVALEIAARSPEATLDAFAGVHAALVARRPDLAAHCRRIVAAELAARRWPPDAFADLLDRCEAAAAAGDLSSEDVDRLRLLPAAFSSRARWALARHLVSRGDREEALGHLKAIRDDPTVDRRIAGGAPSLYLEVVTSRGK